MARLKKLTDAQKRKLYRKLSRVINKLLSSVLDVCSTVVSENWIWEKHRIVGIDGIHVDIQTEELTLNQLKEISSILQTEEISISPLVDYGCCCGRCRETTEVVISLKKPSGDWLDDEFKEKITRCDL